MRWKVIPLIAALLSCKAERGAGTDNPAGMPCASDRPCGAGQQCIGGACVADLGTCRVDNDCLNDSYCACPPDISADLCLCVPWGMKPRGASDPTCAGQAFLPEAFETPILKCQWPPAGAPPQSVLTTPLVIDLDKDGQPEILFHTAAPARGAERQDL